MDIFTVGVAPEETEECYFYETLSEWTAEDQEDLEYAMGTLTAEEKETIDKEWEANYVSNNY